MTLEVAKRITYSTARSILRVSRQHQHRLGILACNPSRAMFHPQETNRRKRTRTHSCSNRPRPVLAGYPRRRPKTRLLQASANPLSLSARFGSRRKNERLNPETSIFTMDPPDVVKKKIWNAFTGGKGTAAEQRKTGADPTVCSIFQYYFYLFEDDNKNSLNENAGAEQARCCAANAKPT